MCYDLDIYYARLENMWHEVVYIEGNTIVLRHLLLLVSMTNYPFQYGVIAPLHTTLENQPDVCPSVRLSLPEVGM